MPEPRVEYGCRFTGWTGRNAQRKRDTVYETAGFGAEGLAEARRMAESTRLWQPHHDLPVDAVVVSRPVHEWTEVTG